MKDTNRLLIITADDFGMCPSVNKAIKEVVDFGLVKNCDLIPVAPAFKDAVNICKNYPLLDIGVHITLTSEFPALSYRPISNSNKVSSLIDPKSGAFLKNVKLFQSRAKPIEVYREVVAQIEYILSTGIKPTHLSSHIFVLNCFGAELSAMIRFNNMIMEISKEYKLPFRMPLRIAHAGVYNGLAEMYRKQGYLVLDDLISGYKIDKKRKESFYMRALSGLNEGITELLVHCGNPGAELKKINPRRWACYNEEKRIFTSQSMKEHIEKNRIKLINWSDLKIR
ncbi:MAG: ChbG/HpnK family deacetylase [Candidatus Omnitrophica bacterium]|nr:ChbG/HpnK family deacetylase [Candidatus Omnitrophota bacterium]